jgi:predicted kinase
VIIAMRGLPGSGKSTLARALTERIRAVVLDKDAVRAALFPGDTTEYSSAQDDFVIKLMMEAAQTHILRGRMVLIDGRVHARQAQVEMVHGLAGAMGAKFGVIECVCKPETALRRIEADLRTQAHPAKNRDAVLLRDQIEKWEELDQPPLCVVDTEQPLDLSVEQAMAAIQPVTSENKNGHG